jgi:hypothetical protein
MWVYIDVSLCLRLSGAYVGELPFQIPLEVLETVKGDFELVRRVERRRIVEDLNVQKRNGRHVDGSCVAEL